jgi:predicted ATPase
VIGLCGAHRTGKTSLARAYAEKHGIAFVQSPVTKVWAELGLDPAKADFDFTTRLNVQEVILERIDQAYENSNGVEAIADRTPIDLLGYTMAEALSTSVSEKDMERFHRYVQRCFDVLNRRFSVLVLVQPGIPLHQAENKGSLNAAYIEHLNSLMLGLSVDQRVKMPHYYIPRQLLKMEDRLAALENAVGRATNMQMGESQSWRAAGGFMQ